MQKWRFVLLGLFLCVLSLLNCDLYPKREWTIMVYMGADNNLEPEAILNFNQMEAVDARASGVDVIVLFDRAPAYDTSNDDWTNTRLYRIKYDKKGVNTNILSERLSSVELGLSAQGNEELNMADPLVVSCFIDFCKRKFTADNYAIVFWDHGSGWRTLSGSNNINTLKKPALPIDLAASLIPSQTPANRFICQDITTDSIDFLYTQEIHQGIAGKGLSVIAYDLCLTGMIEVMYETRNDAAYMVASEDLTPAAGWNYATLLGEFVKTDKTPLDFVNTAVNAFKITYPAREDMALSGVDLTKIDAVMTAFNAFANALYIACITQAIQTEIFDIFYYDTEAYLSGFPGDLNLDLWDAAEQIQSRTNYADAEATALKAAISEAVVSEWHSIGGNLGTHGIAVHFCALEYSGPAMSLAYCKNSDQPYPLAFVADSAWVPVLPLGPGLLYRLFYETLPF